MPGIFGWVEKCPRVITQFPWMESSLWHGGLYMKLNCILQVCGEHQFNVIPKVEVVAGGGWNVTSGDSATSSSTHPALLPPYHTVPKPQCTVEMMVNLTWDPVTPPPFMPALFLKHLRGWHLSSSWGHDSFVRHTQKPCIYTENMVWHLW